MFTHFHASFQFSHAKNVFSFEGDNFKDKNDEIMNFYHADSCSFAPDPD